MGGIELEGGARRALEQYVTAVRCAERDKRELERAVSALCREPRWEPVVSALRCVKGIDEVTALCLAAEAGSFSRFRSAPAYASWLGLTPSEHSSGEREARGGITKAGNSASRRALVESAWHYVSCSPRPKAAPAGDNPAGRRLRQEAHGALRRAARRRQEAVRRERRRGPRARVLGVGARLPRRGHDGLGRPPG